MSKLREKIAYQIEGRGIKDPVTLQAVYKVDRIHFLPPELRGLAYHDSPVPLSHKQTASQPYIIAYMVEALQPGPRKRVLEVGTGCGYQTALLAEVFDEVFSIEIVPELAHNASKVLYAMDYANVDIAVGNGRLGRPEHAPYDAIVVSAASHRIPRALLEQLAPQGRLVIPLGLPHMHQTLTLVQRKGDGFTKTRLLPVRFVPLKRR